MAITRMVRHGELWTYGPKLFQYSVEKTGMELWAIDIAFLQDGVVFDAQEVAAAAGMIRSNFRKRRFEDDDWDLTHRELEGIDGRYL